MIVSFSVVGVPIAQGSKHAFKTKTGKVVMVEGANAAAAARHKSWRSEVAAAARAVAPPEPFAGPVSVRLAFRFLSTASDPYRTRHASTPDADKIARLCLDALKVGRVVVDDSRVWQLIVAKRYCEADEAPGVDIDVRDDAEAEAEDRLRKKQVAKAMRAAAKAGSVLP